MNRPRASRLFFASLLGVMIAIPSAYSAAPGVPEGAFSYGFARGNLYRTWTDDQRQLYVAGIIDGLMFSPVVGGRTAFVTSLNACLSGLPIEQDTAVVDKAINADPEHWDGPLNFLVYKALQDFCSARGKPLATGKGTRQ
jgi:hypothetical protein